MINVNGQILGPEHAKVSVFDRGYLFGDSIYEVVRTYHGEFFLIDEHLMRLEKSAELCHMALDQSPAFYKQEIYRTFHHFRALAGQEKIEAYARIIVSRGVGSIGFGLQHLLTPTQYTVIIQPVDTFSSETYQNGIRLKVSERLRNNRRALDPAMKSGNYLNSLLAYLEAVDKNYADALLCNGDGHITEGTTFNIFYLRRGILATPPVDIGILDGITRRRVIQGARELGIPIREVRFPAERLYEADEVFLSSSIRELLAVTEVDQYKIGKGICGPLTQKLHLTYRKSIRASES